MWAGLSLLDCACSPKVVRLSEPPHLCGRSRLVNASSCTTLSSLNAKKPRMLSIVKTAVVESRLRKDTRRLAALALTGQQEPPLWDVVGLGQAMVDISAAVDDEFVARAGIAKGERR